MFHQELNYVSIFTNGKTYMDTVTNFKLDVGDIYEELPLGVTERIYDPSNSFHTVRSDGVLIPQDNEWILGNTYVSVIDILLQKKAEREQPPQVVPSPLTQEEIIKSYTSQVQHYMDSVAQTRNYDSIFALCSYANEFEPNPKFQQEGKAAVLWRSAVWTKCYEILADIQAGTRSVPEDIISELPLMKWGEDL